MVHQQRLWKEYKVMGPRVFSKPHDVISCLWRLYIEASLRVVGVVQDEATLWFISSA